jgi:hypothetical protein
MLKNLSEYSNPTYFINDPASEQNGVDLFDWTCKIPVENINSGNHRVFEPIDVRPSLVLKHFNSLKNWDILDLGTFEGGHSYQLESYGAIVTAIEAHPINYLKCLIAKNTLSMTTKFLLGDFQKYIEKFDAKYDLIFASGVLYHMYDPVSLIRSMSKISKNIFLWSHYVCDQHSNLWDPQYTSTIDIDGNNYTYYNYQYDVKRSDRVYSGTKQNCNRMTLKDIKASFLNYGYTKITVLEDQRDHPGGPAVSLIAEQK